MAQAENSSSSIVEREPLENQSDDFEIDNGVDSDDALIERLEAEALAEEERVKAEEGNDEGDPAPQPATDPKKGPDKGGSQGEAEKTPEVDPAVAASQEKPKPNMIPEARFSEVVHERNQYREMIERLQQENHFLKGVNYANRQGQAPKAEEPKAPTPAERREAALKARSDAMAKYDSGDMTAAEWAAELAKVDNELDQVRQEETRGWLQSEIQRLTPKHEPKPQQPSVADEEWLMQRTVKIAEDYPHVAALTAEDCQILAQVVINTAAAKGQPIPQGPRGDAMVREGVGKLASAYAAANYPDWAPPAPANANAAQPTPAGGGEPKLTAEGEARLRKFELAANHPPNTNETGRTGTESGMPTSDDQLAAMSEAQLEKMMDDPRFVALMER